MPSSHVIGFRAVMLSSAMWSGVAHAGDLTITPRLDVVYDSNVGRASDEVAESRGLEQSDVRYSPGVLFETGYGQGRRTLFVRGDIGYDFYQRNDQLNSERLLVEAGGQLKFSRCQASPLVSLSRRQTDVADFIDLERVKNKQTTGTVRLDGRCGGPTGFMPIFGVAQTWNRNSDDLRRYGNSSSTTFHGGIAYARPTFGEISLSGRYTRVRYAEDSPLGLDVGEGYNSYSLGARYERRISSRLGGSVGVYYTTVDPLDTDSKFGGLTADANIDATLGAATRVNISFVRDVTPANLLGGEYVIGTIFAASARHALSPRLELTARGSIVDRNVRGEFPALLPIIRNEKRYLAAAGASYRFMERTNVAIELARETRKVDPDIFDYSSTRAMLSLRHTIGRRK